VRNGIEKMRRDRRLYSAERPEPTDSNPAPE
jgi:hypothetical protein